MLRIRFIPEICLEEIKMKFDIRQTNIAKGIAILLLLWHHLFLLYPENEILFSPLFLVNGTPIESVFSRLSKVCVAIFLFLSGFGLYKSWIKTFSIITQGSNNKPKIHEQFKFVKNRLLKLLFGFWFIYIIFVPLSIWFGTPFWEVYNYNPLFGIIDFLGLANLFSTPTMNRTWWFMSTIIVFYILFPFFMKVFSYSKELLLAASAVLMVLPIYQFIGDISLWLFPLVLGMYFADKNLFIRFDECLNSWAKKITVIILALIFTAILKNGNNKIDSFFAIAVISTSCIIISRIPFISKILEFFGRYSSGIFMFHTFIYMIYFETFIYSFKYPILIYFVFVVICIVLAVAIEWLKRLIHVDKLLLRLIK